MSTLAVVRRDFLDVRRAKLVWAPAALYTLFMLLFFWGQSTTAEPDFYLVLWSLAGLGGALVVPLIALVAAYLSIAGERESGRIKFSLGVPVERSQFVLGKFAARSLVVAAGLVLSFAVGIAAAFVFVPEMEFAYGDYAAFVGLTLLYATAYVAVAVGISAATSSRSRAMGGAIGFFFLFNIVWNFLPVSPHQMLVFLLERLDQDPADYEHLLELVFSLSPTGAYLNSIELVMPDRFVDMMGGATVASDPFFVRPWFMLVLLALWTVVPLALGYWRFERADLG